MKEYDAAKIAHGSKKSQNFEEKLCRIKRDSFCTKCKDIVSHHFVITVLTMYLFLRIFKSLFFPDLVHLRIAKEEEWNKY